MKKVKVRVVPLEKQSKAAKREYHAARRGSWNGLSPVTRVAKDKRTYDRAARKRRDRREMEE